MKSKLALMALVIAGIFGSIFMIGCEDKDTDSAEEVETEEEVEESEDSEETEEEAEEAE